MPVYSKPKDEDRVRYFPSLSSSHFTPLFGCEQFKKLPFKTKKYYFSQVLQPGVNCPKADSLVKSREKTKAFQDFLASNWVSNRVRNKDN